MKNLILICGDEVFLKEQKKREMLTALKAEGSINFNMFDEETADPLEVSRLMETAPFFEDHRTLLLSGTGWCKGSVEDALLEAFESLPSYTYVILEEAETDASNRLYQLIRRKGDIFRFSTADSKKGREATQSRTEIRNWARDYLKAAGRSIGSADLNFLTEMTGYDMQNLSTELEKLICYTMDRGTNGAGSRGRTVGITREDIDSICSRTLTDKVFEMTGHRLQGRIDEALRILEELFAIKVPPMRIMYILAKQYQQAHDVKECLQRSMSDAEIMNRTELKDWQLRRLKEQTSRTSTAELRAMLERLADAEFKVKSGDLPDRLAVELVISG